MANEVDIVIRVQDRTGSGRNSAEHGMRSFADRAGGSVKKFAEVAKTGGLIAGAALAKFGMDAVNAASDAQQSLGGTQAVFGKYADVIIAKSKGAAEAVGLSANDYRESANIIGSLFKNQGVAADQLAAKTDKVVKMGADLSATYGGTAADAVEALTAAYKGEFDPLERYGVSLKQSTINQEAFTVAGVKTLSAFNKLTPAQQAQAKQQATTNILLKQSKDATGQFQAQTGTLAEKIQILKAKYTDLSAQIGEKLIPVITKLLDKGVALVGWLEKNPAAVQVALVAIGALAAGFVALGVAMLANPVSLAVIGIIALGAALAACWKKFATFREVTTTVFAGVATALLSQSLIIQKVFHAIADTVLNTVIVVLRALGKIPGNGWAKRAADDVQGFKNAVDTGFNASIKKTEQWRDAVLKMPKIVKLKSDITDLSAKIRTAQASLKGLPKSKQTAVLANIAQLQRQLAKAHAALNKLQGKTVDVFINTHLSTTTRNGHTAPSEFMAHGGISGAAGGGPRSGLTMVGEQGRELVRLAPGSTVHPHGTTEAMLAKAMGGGADQVIRILIEGTGVLASLRKEIRIKGGNVQGVLGS